MNDPPMAGASAPAAIRILPIMRFKEIESNQGKTVLLDHMV
jgi:hypothetical protein